MPTESELRAMLESTMLESTEPSGKLDAARIIRRSKARRLPAQIAAGGTFVLAVAAIGVLGFTGVLDSTTTNGGVAFESAESADSAQDAESAPDNGTQTELGAESGPAEGKERLSAEELNPCGEPVTKVAPHPRGLTLTVDFPEQAPAETDVTGTATLINNGDEPVSGTTAASPVITVADSGVVVWHTNGFMTMQAVIVDLEPGESLEYQVTLSPVRCGPEDEIAGSFRADLPALEPGEYTISAAIGFLPDSPHDAGSGSEASFDLIGGPASSIELR